MDAKCLNIMKILADATRLAVVRLLLVKPSQVKELNKHLPVSQSLLSHHLKQMRDAGLVISTRVGKSVLYQISPQFRKPQSCHSLDMGCCLLDFKQGEKP